MDSIWIWIIAYVAGIFITIIGIGFLDEILDEASDPPWVLILSIVFPILYIVVLLYIIVTIFQTLGTYLGKRYKRS
jgi:hypothetical protein